MLRIILCLCVFVFSVTGKIQSQDFRTIKNSAFQRGEKLTYRVYYDAILTGKVTAGEAILEVMPDNQKVANRNTMRIVGKGYSKGAFNYFFKVVDRYETIIDENAIMPWLFIRRVNEGGYKISQDVTFNQAKKTVVNNNKSPVKVPAYTQDIISALYYARTWDVTNIKPNDELAINFFLDDSVYVSKIIFVGRETIKTSQGTFKCLKFKPQVLSGKVFKEPYPITLWVSDDANHIPILAESGIIVGKVKMELIGYSGLKNPFIAKMK